MKSSTIIIHTITRLDIGGAQDHLYELVRGLQREGIKQMIITGRGGMWCRRFAGMPVDMRINPFLIRSINPLADSIALIWAVLQLCLLKMRYKRIILHSNVPKAGMIYRIAGFLCGVHPNIFTIHGWSFHNSQPLLLRKCIIAVERILSHMTDLYISVCRENINAASINGFRIDSKSIVIYGGIDTKRFARSPSNKHIKTIGTVSNFKPMKRNDIFIDIAQTVIRKYPYMRFIIVGDGPRRLHVERLISERGLDGCIDITGYTDNVEQYLSDIDLIVFTSLWEGLPRVLIEAYVSNIPFVSFPAGGIGEFACIAGVPQFVTRGFEEQEIIEIVNDILEDRLKWQYTYNGDFSVSTMIKKHIMLYHSLQDAKSCKMQRYRE